jgi:hypothetical protein
VIIIATRRSVAEQYGGEIDKPEKQLSIWTALMNIKYLSASSPTTPSWSCLIHVSLDYT